MTFAEESIIESIIGGSTWSCQLRRIVTCSYKLHKVKDRAKE